MTFPSLTGHQTDRTRAQLIRADLAHHLHALESLACRRNAQAAAIARMRDGVRALIMRHTDAAWWLVHRDQIAGHHLRQVIDAWLAGTDLAQLNPNARETAQWFIQFA